MRPTLKINTKNKFDNELWFGDKLIARGGDGLVSVELKRLNDGKRLAAEITLVNVNIIITDTECPEEHRYDEISAKVGHEDLLSQLSLACDMLKLDVNACNGCPWNPQAQKQASRQDEVMQRVVSVG